MQSRRSQVHLPLPAALTVPKARLCQASLTGQQQACLTSIGLLGQSTWKGRKPRISRSIMTTPEHQETSARCDPAARYPRRLRASRLGCLSPHAVTAVRCVNALPPESAPNLQIPEEVLNALPPPRRPLWPEAPWKGTWRQGRAFIVLLFFVALAVYLQVRAHCLSLPQACCLPVLRLLIAGS